MLCSKRSLHATTREEPPLTATKESPHAATKTQCSGKKLNTPWLNVVVQSLSRGLQPHGLQHASLPCPSPSPGACSNSCPLSWWCHPAISSSVVPFSSYLQSFPTSGSFLMSWLFTSGGQSIGASASASVLLLNIQDWFPLEWIGWTSLQSKGLSRIFSNTIVQKHQFFTVQHSLWSKSHITSTGKTIALTRWTLVDKIMSLLFNILSRLVIDFLPRSKQLLISWLQSQFAVILQPKKIKSLTVSIVSSSICHEGTGRHDLHFWMLSFKSAFSLSSFYFIKRLFSSSLLSAIRVVSSTYLRLLIFLPEILIPACVLSSLAFHMIFSAYKLNKQGDNIQPWHTPFPILNQSIIACPVLTVASWPAYRLLRRQVRWSGIPIS